MWVELLRYPGILVSCEGIVVSLRFGKWRVLSQSDKKGYRTVDIHGKSYRVHRLVMEAFCGESELQVNHKNYCRADNRLENLEYCTASQNMRHAMQKPGRAHGISLGEVNGRSKLTDRERIAIQELRGRLSPSEISRLFNISKSQVYVIFSSVFSE